MVDTCFGALAQIIPHRITGAPVGTSMNVALGGYDPVKQRHYIMYFYTGGGHGGFDAGDGISHACTSVGLAKTPPIEIVEQHAPVLFEEYALRVDSGGAGRHRGGLGLQYRLRLLHGEGRIAVMGDRTVKGPYGVFGGEAGAPAAVSMTLKDRTFPLPMGAKIGNVVFEEGDLLHVGTPGGGGYGSKAERRPEKRAEDLRRGYVTAGRAAALYGT